MSEKSCDFDDVGRIQGTPLSELFFSKVNMDTLSDYIRYLVHTRTQRVLPHVDRTTLRVVMRGIFLSNAEFRSTHVTEQVRVLNADVARWCVQRIVTNMESDQSYQATLMGNAPWKPCLPTAETTRTYRQLEPNPFVERSARVDAGMLFGVKN